MGGKEHGSVILFDESKGELFKLSDGYKSLLKKLKTQWKVIRYGTIVYILFIDLFGIPS